MLKKILLLAAFAITPLLLSETASAQCYAGGYGGGYGGGHGYHAPVAAYRVPVYGNQRSIYRSGYRGGISYGSPYRYGSRYGRYGYGGYGGYGGYYGRGTAISIGRGGFGLSIGF